MFLTFCSISIYVTTGQQRCDFSGPSRVCSLGRGRVVRYASNNFAFAGTFTITSAQQADRDRILTLLLGAIFTNQLRTPRHKYVCYLTVWYECAYLNLWPLIAGCITNNRQLNQCTVIVLTTRVRFYTKRIVLSTTRWFYSNKKKIIMKGNLMSCTGAIPLLLSHRFHPI